ncbi:fimbrial assembly protein [Erwinia sp. OLTSP20]|nr:fimbrial assembly protein [Erwinia sp. OLSSP12]PIJ78816.1 fimbrial assembly protein [Erwinia sp. OLCASP19]PIJ79975.1 fimbrial assembly protein [Erwinia sp. OLMTSP26]PIJ80652.1 fimbrial assembly protein [Erwinia sp. OLMDSP33]PIJ89196.1 fimbrial assembly protein [Erwinia sp. OLTSP20]PIJ92657.1 fimbrial assembly protein [Erwinia sp. OLFS4]
MAGSSIEFNTDVLDVNDRAHVDLSEFTQAGYLMPGNYLMTIKINDKNELPEQSITFLPPADDPHGSVACITPETVKQLGLKSSALHGVRYWHDGECLDLHSLKGLTARGDLGHGTLYLSVPQAYLEYANLDWDPPSAWDNGIPGILLDYNLNAQATKPVKGNSSRSLSGNGTTGANLGPWRLRADWQGNYNSTAGHGQRSEKHFDWSRFYAFRAIAALRASLTVGESYLSSDIFDSFRYLGASLVSDDNMLPPNLRGYAPEVTGVAKTNAKVTISQQGRVLYQTTVAAGPFRIQDLNSATSGTLDVKIEEQDGSVRTFQVNTANIPYLTRPGEVRYKVALGKPTDYQRHSQGPGFASGEFSWGVNNGWSLFGGSVLGGNDYYAIAIGIGRDLMVLGALSFDVTQSRAVLPQQGNLSGRSFRLSYSKRFDKYNSQVTFAGYRFSERNFMTMSQYLEARYQGSNINNSKELYTISLTKQFIRWGLSAYLSYSHQTWWNRPANDNYSLSLSRYFDFWMFKNASVNLSAYRTLTDNQRDDGLYLSLNIPWGDGITLTYDNQISRSGTSNMVGYFDRLNDHDSYNLKAGNDEHGRASASAYYTHDSDLAQVTANASYQGGAYRSVGMSLQGGMTATARGAALHRINTMGGTRMMVDTNGVSDIPVRGYGSTVRSNFFGKAVISDVNSYYRNSVSIDVNDLADNVDATRSVVQGTLTEGAIGYRRFGIISGEKAMAKISLDSGGTPPFGAMVTNADGNQAGIVSDDGSVWLTGLAPDGVMQVRWDGETHCVIRLPGTLPALDTTLPLTCNASKHSLSTEVKD